MASNDSIQNDALNYEKLKDIAIQYIQKIGYKHWTDFNVHDPGVTILEALCFSLCDLAYRTGFAITDLLTPENGKNPELSETLYKAEQILSSNPTNVDEYRKLILEYVPGIRNVWVYPTTKKYTIPHKYKEVFNGEEDAIRYYRDELKILVNPDKPQGSTMEFDVHGFYNIYIERESEHYVKTKILSDDDLCQRIGLSNVENIKCNFNADKYDKWLCEYVSQLLNRHRNLNELFLNVRVLEPIDIKIQLEIETSSDVYESIITEIYEKLDNYISPKVRLHSLDNFIEKKQAQEYIYQGFSGDEEGYMRYGIVDMDELKASQRRVMLKVSDVCKILKECNDIEDVKKVRFVAEDEKLKINSLLGHIQFEDALLENCCFRIVPFKYDENSYSKNSTSNEEPDNDDNVKKYLLKTQNPLVEKMLRSLHKGNTNMYSLKKEEEVVEKENSISFIHESRIFKVILTKDEIISDADLKHVDITYPLPQGRYRNTHKYYSFQNLLPKAYRMRKEDFLKNDRKYDVNQLQLKGYLIFFDQFLANYLKQLDDLNNYFNVSEAEELSRTLQYASLLSDERFQHDIAGIDRVLKGSVDLNTQDFLENREWNYNYILEHRNRLLDNLLAMFNDSFEELVPLVNMNDHDKFDGREYLKESIKDKARLLREYVSLNQNRTVAITRSGKLELSGVENRILAKLGINSRKAKLSSCQVCKEFKDEKGRDDLSAEFENRFGVHVLEHMLLLPLNGLNKDSFLEMTTIEDRRAVADPYSFYVTVLYPGSLKIFQGKFHEDFRHYVRKVIRDELPAHIDAVILGISDDNMKRFEDAYEEYLDHLAHPEKTPEWMMLQTRHIIKIKKLLLGFIDVNGDENHSSFGVDMSSRNDLNLFYSSCTSWKGICLKAMLESINRQKKDYYKLQKRKKEMINLINKMMNDALDDKEILDLVWHVLNEQENLMREFETLLNDPERQKENWIERVKRLANDIYDILQGCLDVNGDEPQNNVIWGIERPKRLQPNIPLPVTSSVTSSIPTSKTWLGLSIVGMLKSIIRNNVKVSPINSSSKQ